MTLVYEQRLREKIMAGQSVGGSSPYPHSSFYELPDVEWELPEIPMAIAEREKYIGGPNLCELEKIFGLFVAIGVISLLCRAAERGDL